MQPNIDYVNLTDKKLMFDNYLVDLENMVMGTKINYDFNSKLNGKEIVTKTNCSIKASTIIESKNKNFDNVEVNIDLKDIQIIINEEQIVLLVLYLENMNRENRIMNNTQKKINESEKEKNKELTEDKKEEKKEDKEEKKEEISFIKYNFSFWFI